MAKKIDFDKVAAKVRKDGEQCDTETVERLYNSLDDENKAACTEKYLFDVLINTQPQINS